MMSICLQSMVDELMVKKSGGSIKKVSIDVCFVKTCQISVEFQSVNASMFDSFKSLSLHLFLPDEELFQHNLVLNDG